MKMIRIAMNTFLAFDLKEYYPQIEVKSTGEYIGDDAVFELTSDEIYLRDWILSEYDSEMTEDEIEDIFSESVDK